jgi:hypothetical protein
MELSGSAERPFLRRIEEKAADPLRDDRAQDAGDHRRRHAFQRIARNEGGHPAGGRMAK